MPTIGGVADADALYRAARLSMRGVAWKASVQRYEINMLRNIRDSKRALEAGESPAMGFHEFTINERGKTRHVKSVHIKERVVQRALCDEALVPALQKGLEYDNCAGQKGKGIHFALRRLEAHLRRYYRRTGSNAGYILLVDFKGYYDNIRHDKVYERLDRKISDEGVKRLARQFIEPFGDGKSLGIGSQISQILAVDYAADIDRLIKHGLGIKESARYMDDTYLLHEDKEYLKYCLGKIREKCAEYGIVINERKTQIVKLRRTFSFLKVRWTLTDTGRVIARLNRDTITRERRKLKRFRQLLDQGLITMDRIEEQYGSWKGDKGKGRPGKRITFRSHGTIRRMDRLYNELFINNTNQGGTGNERKTQVPDRERDRGKEAAADGDRLPGHQVRGGIDLRGGICGGEGPARGLAQGDQRAGKGARKVPGGA